MHVLNAQCVGCAVCGKGSIQLRCTRPVALTPLSNFIKNNSIQAGRRQVVVDACTKGL